MAAILLGLWAVISPALAQIMTEQVPVGSMAKLSCPSNDDDHRFWFWQLYDDKVVGPDNYVDRRKYKFDVLTGTLLISGVSTGEAGYYKCVSRGISSKNIKIQTVELVVQHPCTGDNDKEFENTLLQALLAVGIVLVLAVLATTCYVVFRRRRRGGGNLSEDEEEFLPESSSRPRPYNKTVTATASIVPKDRNQTLDEEFDQAFKPVPSTSSTHL